MNKQRASAGAKKPQTVTTDFDDWETDPDYVRDMDEMDQRWGSKRTVGSIDMNDLIEQVNKEHEIMREKFKHPSQKLSGFTNEDILKTPRDPVQGFEERMSKHSSTQEISRKVYTSTGGSESGIGDSFLPSERITNAKKIFAENTPVPEPSKTDMYKDKTKQTAPMKTSSFKVSEPEKYETSERIVTSESSTKPSMESKTTTTKRIIREEKSSASSSRDDLESGPQLFKSIQEKIDAFKKEFDELEKNASSKYDASKIIKKTSNYHTKSSSDLNHISKNSSDRLSASRVSPTSKYDATAYGNSRPTSTSPTSPKQFTASNESLPKADIKGLSKRFETLFRESDDEFKRRTDAKRKEFFDQIRNQVRETRKNLDGFDTIDDESSEYRVARPKVYTRSETTKEEVVSKVVKEGDKIIENETKRNVERSSSCHGSSDEETNDEPTSIRYITQQHMNTSPTSEFRSKSPIDEIKRKVPVVEPEIKGAGLMARTLYDYQAAEDDELTFDVDDLITNIEKVSQEWYVGTITKGGHRVTGLFPANYVKLLNDSSDY